MNTPRNLFHKAIEGLQQHHGNLNIARFLADNIMLAHKFIMPDAGRMTDRKPFDDLKEHMRLPFDRIALLREVEIAAGISRPQICLAVASHLVPQAASPADFLVCDCILAVPERNAWSPTAPIGVEIRPEQSGIKMHEFEYTKHEEQLLYGKDFSLLKENGEGFGALNGLAEMMVMLSLSNVTTRLVEAPAALNKKRMRQGKLPLYDYHVLLVDGEDVSAYEGDNRKTDIHVRSHFRRGHIRRLDAQRRVWVRAAYVHGRADGFVDKDYKVATA